LRRRVRPFIPPPKAISAVNRRLATLPAGLRAHIERARATAIPISQALGVDLPRVDFALAAHDLYRAEPDAALLDEAGRHGWQISEFERRVPLMLHGPVAGLWLAAEGGIADRAVLEAITYHTTFAPGLGQLEAAVFLADKIEPGKLARTPWLSEVRDLAMAGRIAEAIFTYLSRLSEKLVGEGAAPHPRAAETVAWIRSGGGLRD
jgi:predicted HD superfamily hydrolase involved in NAD metabolism